MSHLQLVLGVFGFVLAWVGLGLTVLPELMVRFMDLPPVRKVTRNSQGWLTRGVQLT